MVKGAQIHPSTKGIPLSENRIQTFKTEFAHAFERQAIGRKLVNLTPFSERSSPVTEYTRFAILHLVDRIWFVEGTFGGTEYASSGIGGDYGIGLAEAETRYVTGGLRSAVQENHVITYSGDLNNVTLTSAFQTIRRDGFAPTIILTNISDELILWGNTSMLHEGQLALVLTPAAGLPPIPILYSRLMPEGETLMVDSRRLATLHIKESPSVEVSDVSEESEVSEIRESIPTLSRESLNEKVRVLVNEVAFLEIQQPRAGVLLRSTAQSR